MAEHRQVTINIPKQSHIHVMICQAVYGVCFPSHAQFMYVLEDVVSHHIDESSFLSRHASGFRKYFR